MPHTQHRPICVKVNAVVTTQSSAFRRLEWILNRTKKPVVVVDLPLLRVVVKGSDNPISLEKPCQASLPPDQQRHHSLGRHPEVQYVA